MDSLKSKKQVRVGVNKKKVLIISYYFPPLGMGGVQRVSKFVKYLPSFGWEPVVLTVKEVEYLAQDESLLDEIPDGVKVFRCDSFDPLRVLFLLKKIFKRNKNSKKKRLYVKESSRFFSSVFFPDPKIGWFPFALAKGFFICKKEKVDLIFSTYPPPTAHLVAYFLKILTGKKWVADFRDPWVGYRYQNCPTFFHRLLKEKTEEKIFRKADKLVTVNQKIAEKTKEKISGACEVIPSGYDEADFSFHPDEKSEIKRKDYFKIVYCGSLSPSADPEPFFKAFSKLIREEKTAGSKIRLVHLGNFFGIDLDNLLKKYKLSEYIQRLGYLPHKKALKEMSSADLLLLLISEGEGKDQISTGKIFEYLYAKKPILALVPPSGADGELIKRFKRGRVISPEKIDEIKEGILYFFKRKERPPLLDEKDLNFFERKYLTSRLAQVFDTLMS